MAARKRKKKRQPTTRRTAAANPRKRRKRKTRHTAARRRASNPRKRRKARHAPRAAARRKRRKASNPRRRKARHAAAPRRRRARRANPMSRRKKGKRRHKRNPGIPTWAMAGLAAVVGLVSFTVVSAGSFALTQRLDPSLGSLIRNRRIAGGLATLGGIALALVSPMLGAGLASGGLAVLAGTEATIALGGLIDKSPETKPAGQQATQPSISGVFEGGRQRFAGVFEGGRQRFGAVMQDDRQRFGGLLSGGSIFEGETGYGG